MESNYHDYDRISHIKDTQSHILEQNEQLTNRVLKTEPHEYRGFYYDIQLNDPRTRVSLHPNTAVLEYVKNVEDEKTNALIPRWTKIRDTGTAHRAVKHGNSSSYLKIFHPEEQTDRPTAVPKGVAEDGKSELDLNYPYAIEPICSSILKEDFKISITNQFTEMGGDPLSGIFNQAKTSLPLVSVLGDFLKDVTKKTRDLADEKNQENQGRGAGWIGTMATILEGAEKVGKLQTTLMNRALVVQGTRFSFYTGTGVNPENLAMEFTIFPTWEVTNKGVQFVDVYDQLECLIPYVIGDFVPVNFGGFESEADDSRLTALVKTGINIASGIASDFASWQLPPGGFEAYPKDVDIVQKGTLKLRIGTLFALENLVIISCNFTMSKQLIKNPNNPYAVTPAYCDVVLQLKPVTKYSKNSLLRFLKGEANRADRLRTRSNLFSGMRLAEQNLGITYSEFTPGGIGYQGISDTNLFDAAIPENPNPTFTEGGDIGLHGSSSSKPKKKKRK